MTALFWVLAAGLAAAGIAFLAGPLLRRAPPARPDRRAAALAAHRARLAEIEAGEEAPSGGLPAGRTAHDDAARALLRDLDTADRPAGARLDPDAARPRRGAAVLLGLAFPLLAAGLYILLGEPRGLDPLAVRSAAPPGPAEAVGEEVARLLTEAEALARASGNRLEGEPTRLIERALALAPGHRKALWFAAVAALHEGRAEDARVRLAHLRELGPFGEAEARMFEELMNEATGDR